MKSKAITPTRCWSACEQWETPIIARVEDERVLLDLRTVEPAQDAAILAAIERSWPGRESRSLVGLNTSRDDNFA